MGFGCDDSFCNNLLHKKSVTLNNPRRGKFFVWSLFLVSFGRLYFAFHKKQARISHFTFIVAFSWKSRPTHIFFVPLSAADYLLERDYAPPRDFSITWQSNNCRACGTSADDHPPWNLIQYITLCGGMRDTSWQIFKPSLISRPRQMQLCSPKNHRRAQLWIGAQRVVVVYARPSRWLRRRRQPIFTLFTCLSVKNVQSSRMRWRPVSFVRCRPGVRRNVKLARPRLFRLIIENYFRSSSFVLRNNARV